MVCVNKTVITGLAILVLVMGMTSNMVFHMAEAKSMPQHLLNSDSPVKGKFLLVPNGNSSEKKYPIIIGYTPF